MEKSRRISGNRTAEDIVRQYYLEKFSKPTQPDKPKTEPEKEDEKLKDDKNLGSYEEVNLSDYIFLPSSKLYIAKQRTLQGNNWFDAHKKAHEQKARMPTLREFADFLLLLRSGEAEDGLGNKISKLELDNIDLDITEQKDPYRAEWLDADFKVINEILHMNYNHRTINGKLVPQNSEPLESCLMKDCKVKLSSFNKQGLPTEEGTDFSYWHPLSDNNSVAGFVAISVGVGLFCGGDALDSDGGLGVRLVREKIGGSP